MRNGESGGSAAEPARATSLEKALEICEALSAWERGASVTELARVVRQPVPTVHRLLRVLKRRGYVRQDEETARYSLTLKMLDLSFRLLGRSELRLHAYPVIREYVLRTSARAFIAVPGAGEVTYVWASGPDAVAMHTAYGKEMPGHCAIYFGEPAALRRLSCVRLRRVSDVARPAEVAVRLGASVGVGVLRMDCACAPVFDYSGREVARVGLFSHGPDERKLPSEDAPNAWELARLISSRLGHLPGTTLAVTA